MSLIKMMRWGLLMLAAFGSATAQVEIGAEAPSVQWHKWLQGAPVLLGTDHAPSCTAFAFFSQEPQGMQADRDYFVQLQEHFGLRGLRVVVAVGAEGTPGIDQWIGCSVVLDDAAKTGGAWLPSGFAGRDYVVVCDSKGMVFFVGRPSAGLVDTIDHVLKGKAVLGLEERAARIRKCLSASFDDAVGTPTLEMLQPLVEYAPRDGLLNGLLYLTLATKVNDDAAAQELLHSAVARMRKEARPLALFADLVLRGDPHRPQIVGALLPALADVAYANKRDVLVQLAYLRALMLAGDRRAVGRQAMKIRRRVMQTAAGCLDYATLLAKDEHPEIHLDLATIAVDQAEKLGADTRLLAAARYVVALRCAVDEKAAKRIRDVYLEGRGQRSGINNDSWYFMTGLSTMGRYDWFAVGLVERILEERQSMDYFECDTAALAMFLVGRVSEAVALQEQALSQGGEGNAEYEDRLARYKAQMLAGTR